MNAVQDYMTNTLKQGPTEAEQQAARTPPPAIPPPEINGVPQTDLPHPPPTYVWH